MKSVVVEASTVAKAVELAWLKAEKPEEFFIRILQEHQTGFLGFGSQKAKIVFFFKNNQKSDSLFPVLLKQREYSNLFDNKNLKVPAESNKIDDQLNKNVGLQGQGKKKQAKPPVQNHHEQKGSQQKNQQKPVVQEKIVQHNQQKNTQEKPAAGLYEQKNNSFGNAKKEKQHHQVSHKPVVISQQDSKNKEQTGKQELVVSEKSSQKAFEYGTRQKIQHISTIKEPKSKLLQPIESTITLFDDKDTMVKNIAHVLKKVQTQKVVATVSKSAAELQAKVAEKIVDVQVPRVAIKMKRRPLPTDNVGVSGITKSNKIVSDQEQVSNLYVDTSDDKSE